MIAPNPKPYASYQLVIDKNISRYFVEISEILPPDPPVVERVSKTGLMENPVGTGTEMDKAEGSASGRGPS
ncbi:hypothetical protein CDL12_19794 [Handroanthus impetiginosus]|uniref:Uncharacterized protein n=1 Tax=Handroanthus impetiginosus TaxID=429701 RepID=A0A2G9GQQ4_9LAMI|nr:hypothetical protein CDL12_19794 [Handroanthus impetiginosus]